MLLVRGFLFQFGEPCRAYVSRVEQVTRTEREQKEQELAANVRQADLTQLLARLEADLVLLAQQENTSDARAVETAKDMKYVRERQMSLVVNWGWQPVPDFFSFPQTR